MANTTEAAPLYDPATHSFAPRMHEVYRTMRDLHPVYRDPLDRFYAVTRFEDVRAAALDWATFSSASKLENQFLKPSMASFDPPRHDQLRGLVARGFTPRRVADLEPRIRQIATDLIAGFVEEGCCDAINDYALLLPSRVMGELIGIPEDLIPVLRELTDLNMRRTGPADAGAAAARAYDIFATLLEERRRRPASDLLTALLFAEVDGMRLSEDDLLGFCWLLLVGGNDTTTNLIGNGLELLYRHPDQRAQLVDDSSLLPAAIEEMLRIESPSQVQARDARRDGHLPNGDIPAGSRVLLIWGAANLDEREFPHPERFDIHRDARRHLALGHGPHFCMGAALARLEARVAFEEFLALIPIYDIEGEPERIVSSTFRGFESLAMRFSPSPPTKR
jgi:cytochrome P450